MPNTKGTTLENWPDVKEDKFDHVPAFHFALKQSGVNIDFHLRKYFRHAEVSIHHFDSFMELVRICQRFPVDAVIIGGYTDLLTEINLLRQVKDNVFISIIPTVLYHPSPDENLVIAAYENGAEDVIGGAWMDKMVEVRIRRVIERNRRDLAVNPSTRLPGPTIIEREINRMLDISQDFAVHYADLDNFKAYNDFYGYAYGDRVIRLTARIIKDIVFDLCPGGFVGHIAGDDFIFVTPPSQIDAVCSNIVRTFDQLIPYQYEPEDRTHGEIMTRNRKGELETFSLLSISIAVLINRHGTFKHIGEMSKMLADLKKATKAMDGSNYMVERREKY